MLNGQLWKIWKENAFIELCSLFIDILAFELGKLFPGMGILFRFSTQGSEFCTENCSRGRDFYGKKLVAQGCGGGGGGGIVAGQSDTRVMVAFQFLPVSLVSYWQVVSVWTE